MISVAPRLQSASAIPKVRTAHYPSRLGRCAPSACRNPCQPGTRGGHAL